VLQSFFKLLLLLRVSLGMPRARHQFSPAVTIEEAIDRALIDLVSDFGFIGVLDLSHGGDLSSLSLRKKRGEELFFFWQGQILMPPASLAWRFHGCRSVAIVSRDDSMHLRGGDACMQGNLFCFARCNQGIVNDPSVLANPWTHICVHAFFDLINRQVRGCSCDAMTHPSPFFDAGSSDEEVIHPFV